MLWTYIRFLRSWGVHNSSSFVLQLQNSYLAHAKPLCFPASIEQGHISKCWVLKNVKQGKQVCSLPGVT